MFQAISQFVTDKRRLITEYLLLGCVVAIGGLAFSMYLSRVDLRNQLSEAKDEVAATSQRLVIVEDGYETTKQALSTLQMLRDVDNKATMDLYEKYREITLRGEKVEANLQELGKHNEDVKQFFNTRINRALVCVLEPTQCGKDSILKKD